MNRLSKRLCDKKREGRNLHESKTFEQMRGHCCFACKKVPDPRIDRPLSQPTMGE